MKNTFKKALFSLGAIGLVGAGSLGLVSAQGSFGDPSVGTFEGEGSHGLNVAAGDTASSSSRLIQTIKNFINWVLGMLSLIALVILLRGGFQMVTASGDESKYKKGFTILKQAAIGLVVIGLSWLFVTLILFLINRTTAA